MLRRRALRGAALGPLLILLASPARAGTFDAAGDLVLDPADVTSLDLDAAPERYFPDGTDASCMPRMFRIARSPGALEGKAYAKLAVLPGCAERFVFHLPPDQASYRVTLWMRHGRLDANVDIEYTPSSGLDSLAVYLSPTGRTTSDGWVELSSNTFPVDGPSLQRAYIRLADSASLEGVDVDAFEVVREGQFIPQADCAGLGDPACGPDQVCMYNRCVHGPAAVPPLPPDVLRNDVVDGFEGRLHVFYGGRTSRALYLPAAIAQMERMRTAKTAWQFWSAWAAGIHALHDWHTLTDMSVNGFIGPARRLNACFIEGNADLSQGVQPTDPKYADLLVSHVGPQSSGLRPGDRLLAVDGQHPIAWAASLGGSDWGYHVATDPNTFSDYAERLGGPYWANIDGSALIVTFAHEMTVLRCDPSGACDGAPETIQVTDFEVSDGTPDVACDNRPLYHFDPANNPDPSTHYVFGTFFRGQIAETTPSEGIFGMVWDTLDGNGNPHSPVNSQILKAVADWKAGARGVILDHRAGNGGTLDSATNVTSLVRPPSVVAVTRMPIEQAGFDGPSDAASGQAIFTLAKGVSPYPVGDAGWAQTMPVAMILHRDGSASDYLPYGMKGAPNVQIFGPHQTSGAFSTFIEFSSWGPLYFQLASGDTIASDGSALIGHGVPPDVVLLPKQSDLVAGHDTLFDAALAWVRQELKP